MFEQIHTEPDIYRIPAEDGRPVLCSSYLIFSEGEALVVDPRLKSVSGLSAVQTALKELGVAEGRFRIVFTHLHSGHSGAAVQWTPQKAELLIHELDFRPAGKKGPWAYQNRRYCREGYPKAMLSDMKHGNESCSSPEELAGFLQDESEITVGCWTFKCIHTPGHTPGHICLYLPEKGLLFSGDTLLFDLVPHIGIWKGEPHALEDYLGSLERLGSKNIKMIFPAHGRSGGDVKSRIEAISCHYYFRLLELYKLVCDNPGRSTYELAPHFCRYGSGWPGVSAKRKWIAMGETLSHLIFLRTSHYVELRRSGSGSVNFPGKRKLTDV